MKAVCKLQEESDGVVGKFRDVETNEVETKRFTFQNYFYIKDEDWPSVEFMCRNIVSSTQTVENDDCVYRKLYLKNNFLRNKLRNMLEDSDMQTYEADIDSKKRYVLKNYDNLHQKHLKVALMDIETDDRGALEFNDSNEVIARKPILSIAVKDLKTGEVQYIYNKAAENNDEDRIESYEKELLQEYMHIIKQFDVVWAWNGWRFDFPYLRQRFEKHFLDYDELMLIDVDHMKVYEKYLWGSLKSYSLQNVSIHELKGELTNENTKFKNLEEIQKVDWKERCDVDKIYDLWKYYPELLKEYNIQDVELMYLIETKLNYHHLISVTTEICGCLYYDAIHNSRAIDCALIRQYHNKNKIVKSKPSQREIDERQNIKIGGGYTYATPGFYKNLHGFDFASHYVKTAMISFNICNSILIGYKEPNLRYVFNDKELKYIYYCVEASKKHLNNKGELNKNKYEKDIEEKRLELDVDTMQTLMWRFIKNYNNEDIKEYCEKHNYAFTPADINYDTCGWRIHRHRIFKREEGILSGFVKHLTKEREKVKYNMKQYEYKSSEWHKQDMYQNGLKTVGNSTYGVMGLKSFRFFNYDIADCITTTCRYITKKAIEKVYDMGYESPLGDTDSAYILHLPDSDIQKVNDEFTEFFNNILSVSNVFSENHIVFEYEKTLLTCVVTSKKKYYFKFLKDNKYIYDTQGGTWQRRNVRQLVSETQYNVLKDILDENFDKMYWYNKLKKLKEKIFNMELEEEHVVVVNRISKNPDEYGQPIMDKITGKQKLRKSDGQPMFAPVPSYIQVAKELNQRGKNFQAGDMIEYVITEAKPKQKAIWVEDYRKNPKYDAEYIWERIESSILEVLYVTHPEEVFTTFKDLCHYSEKQIEKLIHKMAEE